MPSREKEVRKLLFQVIWGEGPASNSSPLTESLELAQQLVRQRFPDARFGDWVADPASRFALTFDEMDVHQDQTPAAPKVATLRRYR